VASFATAVLRGVAGMLLAFFLFVYLPLGFIAVSRQDGWTDAMRSGLGSAVPVPLAAFRSLQAWTPYLLAILALAAVGQAALARWLRRWTFMPPLFLLALLVIALLTGAADRSLRRLSDVSPGVALGFAGLALVALLGALLARGLRYRRFALALAGLAALAVAIRVGADVWGHARLSAYDTGWAREVAAERDRRQAAERAVLGGVARDGDAAPAYQAVLDALRPVAAQFSGMDSLFQTARATPFAEIPDDAREAVDEHASELATLRDAQSNRHCTFGAELEPARVAKAPIWRVARWVAASLVVEGHERAQAGDLQGAAERYLAAVRFAGDVSRGPLVNALIATSQEELGLRAVGSLVLAGGLGADQLASIDDARGRLEATRASIAEGWRGNRLLLGHMEETMDTAPQEAGLQTPRLLPWVVPYRAMAAQAVTRADILQRRLQEALDRDDLNAWRKEADAARSAARSSWNPMLRAFMGYSGPFAEEGNATERLLLTARRSLTWFRLVQAAIMIQAHGAAAALRLPEDPLAPGARLHWARDPAGIRVWSAGIDGHDDGGDATSEKDLVLRSAGRASDSAPGHRLILQNQLFQTLSDGGTNLAELQAAPRG
jgi:hypothetical protein